MDTNRATTPAAAAAAASPGTHPLRPYAALDPHASRPHAADWLGRRPAPLGVSDMAATLRSTPGRRARYELPPSSTLGDLDEPLAPDPSALLQGYLNAGLFSFTSTALVMPFEVGKTLLQVQWVPREDVDEQLAENRRREEQAGRDRDEPPEDLDEDLSDEAEVDVYFSEVTSRPRPRLPPAPPRSRPRPKDPHGYLLRRSVFDEATKPEYTLPIIVQGGTIEMIKAIFRWRGEGLSSLWKGQLTTFMIDTLSSTLQPIFLATLSFAVSPSHGSSLSLPLEHHVHPTLPLAISVGSFLLTGLLLSPLDLIRTRLIVQSAQSRHRKYSGPLHGLSRVLAEEGGWRTTYLHPNLFVPALLDNLFRPLLHLAAPLVLDRYLRLDRSSQPVWYGLADLVLSTAGLLIVLPIETVRKRLQVQSRAPVARSPASAATEKGRGRSSRSGHASRSARRLTPASWRRCTGS